MAYKLHFISLGCAKNMVNCEQMMALCRDAGMELCPSPEGCDAAVVNTCGFLSSANEEAIENILAMAELKKAGKLKKILVTGCMTQRYQGEVAKELPEVDGILGTGSYKDIVDAVETVMAGGTVSRFDDINAPVDEFGRVLTTPGHYAFLRIAEGCDNWCAFCIIPKLRGRYRSREMASLLEEARALSDAGVKELIVIAQDITRYGMDWDGKPHLADFLEELCKLDFHWIRLHYLYPEWIDDRLIDVIAREDKILKYLDIPLQHCNDKILKKMNRRGDKKYLCALLDKLRERIPGLVLRTSIIAGLPGEGEEEFDELCDFLREQKLLRAGVFPYSPEEGTRAAKMERVDSDEAARRADRGHSERDHRRVERRTPGRRDGGPLRGLRRAIHALCRPQLCRVAGHRRAHLLLRPARRRGGRVRARAHHRRDGRRVDRRAGRGIRRRADAAK